MSTKRPKVSKKMIEQRKKDNLGKGLRWNESFKEKYCEEIVELRRQGLTVVEIADKWDVYETTISKWADKNDKEGFYKGDKFRRAFTRAKEAHRAWFNSKMRTSCDDPRANKQVLALYGSVIYRVSDKVSDQVIKLRGFSNAESVTAKLKVLDRALETSKLNTTQYRDVLSGLMSAATVLEKTELEKRIEALETKKKTKKK